MRQLDPLEESPIKAHQFNISIHQIGLCVTGFFFIFPAAFGLLVPILGHMGMIRLAPEPDDTLPDTWTWQSLPPFAISALDFVGGILLLYRRRIAAPILFASAAIIALFLAYRVLMGLYPTPGTSPLASCLVLLVWVTAFVYVYLLRRFGELNQ